MRPVRPCASCTVATPRRARVSITPESARWMLRTTVACMEFSRFYFSAREVPSPRAGHSPRLEEPLQALAAEVRHHLRVRDALRAPELLQAEEARAVVLHAFPVEAPHHVLFLVGQAFHRLLRMLEEELSLFRNDQIVQEAVQPKPARAAVQVVDVFHSNRATAIAVVIGR